MLHNSDTKKIGTHNGKGIANVIDVDALKRSHMPMTELKEKNDPMSMYRTFQRKSRGSQFEPSTSGKKNLLAAKNEYRSFKIGSESSKVPFSTNKRNRIEKSFEKFDRPNGYG